MREHFRNKIPTHNPEVAVYALNQPVSIPDDDPINVQIAQYLKLVQESSGQTGETASAAHALRKVIAFSVEERLGGNRRSALRDSNRESTRPWKSGNDSLVHLRQKYVYKYSTAEGTPENVQYLRHKYQLLQRYLGHYIPQSVFFLTERTPGFTKKAESKPFMALRHATTIQRAIQGETFLEMSKSKPDKRKRPEVVRALRAAHDAYEDAKTRLA